MEFRKVAILLLYDQKGNILLQNRMNLEKNKKIPKKFVADYGIFGGGVEKGETIEQALKRELQEELEINTNNLENLEFLKEDKFQILELDLKVDLHTFIAKMPTTQNIKCHEGYAELFKIEDALKLNISDRDKQAIKELQKKLKVK